MENRVFIFLFLFFLIGNVSASGFGYDLDKIQDVVDVITGADCGAGNYSYGYNTDGSILCRVDQDSGGAGGNPFDQSLNTTDNVAFNNITVTQNMGFSATEYISSDDAGYIDIHAGAEDGVRLHAQSDITFGSVQGLGSNYMLLTTPANYFYYHIGGAYRMIWYSGVWLMLGNMKQNDNIGLQLGSGSGFGTAGDSKLYYDGADLIIDPDVVGTGKVLIGATGDDDLIAGNIGIGTTSPQNTLNVIGDLNVSENATFGQDVIIAGTIYGGSPVKIAGGIEIDGEFVRFAVGDDDGLMLNGSIHLEARNGVGGNLALHEGTEPVTCVSGDGGRLWYNVTNELMWQDKNSVSKRILLNGDNISLEFGDLVSEQNPDGANATRLKGTASDVDVVLGHGTGYFSVWNAADDTNVFNVNDRGNTVIAGDLTVDTSTLFVDSGNNKVGIGTVSPDSVFHIKANIAGTVGSHPAGQLIIQNPADSVTSNAVITGYESDGNGDPDQQLWYLGSSSSSNSNIILLNRRNALLQFGTSSTTRMTILGNGDVGIGTTTPQNKLNVIGDINSTGYFINNANTGITGNYSVGSCWLGFSGGIMYSTNCTAL
ncbi:MAG TPA: hypothetical protein ENI22_00660 [Candidatus Pacearchaeota archaeon]|nr:hypothetical protein [Candidatus Pacearchaeota archaeon]